MKKAGIFILFYAISFAILGFVLEFVTTTGSTSVVLITISVIAVFGWKFINFIQPAYFLWLPLGGWVIYCIVKFIISGMVGMFVVPYHISKSVIDKLDI